MDPKQLLSLLRESEDLKLEIVDDDDDPEIEIRALGTDMRPRVGDDPEIVIEPVAEPVRRETSWLASFVLTLLVLAAIGAAVYLL